MLRIWGYTLGLLIVSLASMYSAVTVQAQDTSQSEIKHVDNYTELMQFSFDNNICPEDLVAANPAPFFVIQDGLSFQTLKEYDFASFTPYEFINLLTFGRDRLYLPMDKDVVIPSHNDCYTILDATPYEGSQQMATPGVKMLYANSARFSVEAAYNVCWEEVLEMDLMDTTGRVDRQVLYFRRDAPSCVNDDGQRLEYMTQPYHYLAEPSYKHMMYGLPPAHACLGDLMRVNPALYPSSASYYLTHEADFISVSPQFLPNDLHICHWTDFDSQVSLYKVSRTLNVCKESIIEASGLQRSEWAIFQATGSRLVVASYVDAPACYDSMGARIGFRDRAVYRLETYELISDVARKNNVCLQDLWDANPALKGWTPDGLYKLWKGDSVFIPEAESCVEEEIYITRGQETISRIGRLYNVCFNRIQEANPSIAAFGYDDALPVQLKLVIPDRPPCFEENINWNGLKVIDYACYREPIDFDKDYTGTEPLLSLDANTDSGNCYDVRVKPVLYENRFYESIYVGWPTFNSYYEIAACYGIAIQDLLKFHELDVIARVKPVGVAFIPMTHDTCTTETLSLLSPRLGQLDEAGVYMVQSDDTLSAIGRRFGYLPSMIAAENNLEAPYYIFPYEKLQMPRMPSLYDIGKAALYVGGVGVGLLAFGVYRMRRRSSKKKQKPVV